jgi:hypothetical protein
MPFSPSDLEWWVWLLIAFGAFISATICMALVDGIRNVTARFIIGLTAFISGITALVTGLIGIVRFVKWAWG